MTDSTTGHKPNLIFAVGNESRGDDALGPLLIREIGQLIKAGALPNQFELIEDFQLQIEHTLDMDNRQFVLFIDAGHHTPAPYRFYRAQAQSEIGHSTHALAPEVLLTVFERVLAKPSPPAYVLCISGESFELGEGLSVSAQFHFDAAFAFVKKLLAQTNPSDWDRINSNAKQ